MHKLHRNNLEVVEFVEFKVNNFRDGNKIKCINTAFITVPIFFIHRLASIKVYQKEKKKVSLVI
jgi:hypothetical protein